MIFLFANYAETREFRQATEWHKIHGNVMFVDGHKLSLPQIWWEEDEHADGKYIAIRASKSLTKPDSNGIIFSPKGPEESKANEDDIRNNLESFVEKEKMSNYGPIPSLIVVKAVSTNIYCMRTTILEQSVELRCHTADVPFVITSEGPLNAEKEIETILSTFE